MSLAQDAPPGCPQVWLKPIETAANGPRLDRSITQADHRQYLFVHSGRVQARLDSWLVELDAGDVLCVPSKIVTDLIIEPGTRAFHFGVADDLLISRVCQALGVPSQEMMRLFYMPRKTNEWAGPSEGRSRDRLWAELTLASRRVRRAGATAVAAYVVLLLFEKVDYAEPLDDVGPDGQAPRVMWEPDDRNAAHLVLRYRRMIEENFSRQWRVQDYCAALDIRPSELAAACRQTLSCTPSALIHERVLLDAKRRLNYSSASASQIAYELGFSDSTYFCRFFRRQTGMSPLEFRRANANEPAGLRRTSIPHHDMLETGLTG